ncbi:hypothetical protein [Vibrio cholerae]|uniref:Uncharacterized protein n=1 Tax=Vibrio cholerae TaxID=666 RepID=A0A655TCU1_VIBCL|nr:hypothetical protein [Vibrio cholerae]AUR69701.1 hypothetical protein C1H56_06275 [Vibrio cholerae]AVL22663.1 hypothetical protein VCA1552_01240 [Vibrio cholerae]AWB73984.1 hypothetical protein A1552VC_01242 [Vibrio cholerae]EJH39942.1 hypothetical protein VCCP104619_2459 [Vibrio cholerae CP1046(19)]EJH84249.1 hypothetical protein VCCP10303_1533 [Vibrio cholerae CP1030(3)]
MVQVLPSQLKLTEVSITNYHRVYASESMSGIQYRHDSGIQWYKGTITLLAYGYENVRILNGFLASLRGRLNAFKLPLGGAYAHPDLVVNPTVNTAHSRGANEIKLSHTGKLISLGSVFTVPNDTKVYTVLENIDGDGVFSIVPSLKKPQQHLAEANFKNPHITALLDGNETTIQHSEGGLIAEATLSWTELMQ